MTRALHADLLVQREDWQLNVSVHVERGEVLAVLGPNGAGKTTMVRALCGLTRLAGGSVRLAQRVLDDPAAGVWVPPERRRIGVVFQDYRLFPHLDVRRNVAFAAHVAGGRRAGLAVADDWLHRSGLAELAGRRPSELSGGQAQRVALVRALASDPALLLLDEPTAALDAQTRAQVRETLRTHLSEFGGPTILVTHDPVEAMLLADRLLVVEAGNATQSGTAREVARRPATPYVARLMGLNLYRGSRRGGSGSVERATVDLEGGGRFITHGDDVSGDINVLVAIRPSAITLSRERPTGTSARNTWQATVAGLEWLHDRVRVEAHGAPDALVDVTPQAVAELALVPGGDVWLSVKATEISAYAAQ